MAVVLALAVALGFLRTGSASCSDSADADWRCTTKAAIPTPAIANANTPTNIGARELAARAGGAGATKGAAPSGGMAAVIGMGASPSAVAPGPIGKSGPAAGKLGIAPGCVMPGPNCPASGPAKAAEDGEAGQPGGGGSCIATSAPRAANSAASGARGRSANGAGGAPATASPPRSLRPSSISASLPQSGLEYPPLRGCFGRFTVHFTTGLCLRGLRLSRLENGP